MADDEVLIRSPERVVSLGEVFTPAWLVRDIVDLVPAEVVGSLETTCLDSACGHGNFLVELLRRKLARAAQEGRQQAQGLPGLVDPREWRAAALRALGRVCGVDISERNVFEARERLVAVLLAEHERVVGLISPAFAQQARAVVTRTVHHGDFLEPLLIPWSGKQFDVIVGNPPYNQGGYPNRPVWHLFIELGWDMGPRYMAMLIPARWYSAGKAAIDRFRPRLLGDRRVSVLMDWDDDDLLPGATVEGGYCAFLWDHEHDDDCLVIQEGDWSRPRRRRLDESDVFVRDEASMTIVRKVLGRMEETGLRPMSETVLPQLPFGIWAHHVPGLKAKLERTASHDVLLVTTVGDRFIQRQQVMKNPGWIDEWKAIVSTRYGGGGGVLGRPRVLPPGSCHCAAYLSIGLFESEEHAHNALVTLGTSFCRLLWSLRAVTKNRSRKTFGFVPAMPTDRSWSDADLAEFFGLDDDDVAHIESKIRPMPCQP